MQWAYFNPSTSRASETDASVTSRLSVKCARNAPPISSHFNPLSTHNILNISPLLDKLLTSLYLFVLIIYDTECRIRNFWILIKSMHTWLPQALICLSFEGHITRTTSWSRIPSPHFPFQFSAAGRVGSRWEIHESERHNIWQVEGGFLSVYYY